MRYAVISDIHANLEAFTAVLKDISSRGVDKLWCLGDIVGYGPDPRECIELIRHHDFIAVPGNHDLAAAGLVDTADFVPDAVISNRWTAGQLPPTDIAFLRNLPPVIEEGDFTLVHASPRDTVWEYLTSAAIAGETLSYFGSPFCFFGHTHRPVVFRCPAGEDCIAEGLPETMSVAVARDRLLLNPGGVGQPRDGDPRASYIIFDSDARTLRHFRVPYDIAATQAKMLKAKLPSGLIARLSYGI